jgi:hypothetical protein
MANDTQNVTRNRFKSSRATGPFGSNDDCFATKLHPASINPINPAAPHAIQRAVRPRFPALRRKPVDAKSDSKRNMNSAKATLRKRRAFSKEKGE